jgi:hypothetical protein
MGFTNDYVEGHGVFAAEVTFAGMARPMESRRS